MSKEVKFRVWDKADKVMCDVTYMKFSKVQYMNVGYRKNIYGKTVDENSLIDENMSGTCVLMQYTGLHDKNGKDIYEGDIILAGYYKWKSKVVWDEKCARFIGLTNDKDVNIVYVDMVDKDDKSTVVVIGNIHENPELLDA